MAKKPNAPKRGGLAATRKFTKRAAAKKAVSRAVRKSTRKRATAAGSTSIAATGTPSTPSEIAQPSAAMMAELNDVLTRHGWLGTAAVIQPGASTAITCPPGQCPSTISLPGPGGSTITIPICKPC